MNSKIFPILTLLLLNCYMVYPGGPSQPDSLFRSDEIISMELRADFVALQNDRDKSPVYRDGELIYYSLKGDTVTLKVKVMVRGNFRRDPANCNFPPLLLNFKKNDVKN